MKKLLEQILKFGVVGVVCFVIDFVITMVMSTVLREIFSMGTSRAALVAAFFGFVISVIVNYLLSMKYVFVRKEDMDRRKEFIIFVILSAFGLVLNEVIIKVCLDVIYVNWQWLQSFAGPTLATAGAKIVATAVVILVVVVQLRDQKDFPGAEGRLRRLLAGGRLRPGPIGNGNVWKRGRIS